MLKWSRDRTLDALLVLALVTIISQRSLRTVPEIFPGGATLGDVLATLATGFIGAWFFNLINVRLPVRRAKRAILSIVGNVVAQYSGQARNILQDMATSAELPAVPRKPDREIIRTILSATNGNSPSRTIHGYGGPPFTYLTWIQYVSMVIRASRESLERLDKASEYLEADTMSAIAAVDSVHLVRLVHNYPEFPLFTNTDLTWMEDSFFEYWEACSVVADRYNAEIFPLVPESARLHLDVDDPAAYDAWKQLFKSEGRGEE